MLYNVYVIMINLTKSHCCHRNRILWILQDDIGHVTGTMNTRENIHYQPGGGHVRIIYMYTNLNL